MEELKSCPFCGGKAVVHVDGGVSVICTTCESRTTCLRDGIGKGGYMGGAIKKVIEKWNRRVSWRGRDVCIYCGDIRYG